MEQSNPRTLAAIRSSWLLLLCLAAFVPAGVLQTRAQPDSNGFISIDCGAGSRYKDESTNLTYEPDAAFTDAGENHAVPPHNILSDIEKYYQDLRSFPSGTRNCYTLRPLTAGTKYLVRATFMYGNYDGLDRPPIFDLYIGVNFWVTVDGWSPEEPAIRKEAVVLVPDDVVQVCLVETRAMTPIISGLELRPLKSSMYPQVNATQGLLVSTMTNLGRPENFRVRYPDDPYDRIWRPYMDTSIWTTISTNNLVQNIDGDKFEAPSKVMQTAITPLNASLNIGFHLYLSPRQNDPSPRRVFVLHFSELQLLPDKAVRQLYPVINGYQGEAYTPPYLRSGAIWISTESNNQFDVSIIAAANSTLPPIINAYEVFHLISTAKIGTDSQDVSAITAIKKDYGLTKDWNGDPCDTFGWTGISCTSAVSAPPRITSVNISFSVLNGNISSTFANLRAVQYMDLSHNNLTGTIPDVLSQLPSLTSL